ncbi:hypothetical protein TNCV_1135401 [Trichonephila clavipes]|nr:hypothetical protein TNCV_1135401 [Trichonephila clavipes]
MWVTVRFCSVPPQLRGRTPWGWSGPSTNLTRGLAARKLFKVPPCRESTTHLQTSMPSPGFEHRPYGAAVSVTNSAGLSIVFLGRMPRNAEASRRARISWT